MYLYNILQVDKILDASKIRDLGRDTSVLQELAAKKERIFSARALCVSAKASTSWGILFRP